MDDEQYRSEESITSDLESRNPSAEDLLELCRGRFCHSGGWLYSRYRRH